MSPDYRSSTMYPICKQNYVILVLNDVQYMGGVFIKVWDTLIIIVWDLIGSELHLLLHNDGFIPHLLNTFLKNLCII